MSNTITKFFSTFREAHEYAQGLKSHEYESIETHEIRYHGWEVRVVPKWQRVP